MAGRHRGAALLPPTSPTAAQPVPPPASRDDTVGEPERDGAPSPRQGLDWARRIELAAVVLGVLLSSLIAAAGIWYSNTQVRDQLKISSQELNVAQEGQITDRYTKAVETLGNKAIDVRLGGIYALQRIMQDSPRDHTTIANVLNTYTRTHTSKPPKKGGEVPADVHAALTILVQRDTTRDKTFTLDLRDTHLPGIELTPRQSDIGPQATSAEVRIEADLLIGANLSGADLMGAELMGADLSGADLTGADLTFTILSEADLSGTDLTFTILYDADLTGANLSGTDLRDAELSGTDLTGAKGLQVREVISAVIDSTTMLPPDLAKDPAVKARIAEVEKQHAKEER